MTSGDPPSKKRYRFADPSGRRYSNKTTATHIVGNVAHDAHGLVRAQMREIEND
jgi:hypothetical protein